MNEPSPPQAEASDMQLVTTRFAYARAAAWAVNRASQRSNVREKMQDLYKDKRGNDQTNS